MSRALLIDTNLLVLWVVGATNLEHIGRFNRTRQYSPEDYLLLLDITASYELVITPHILAETSNLLGQLTEPLRERCRRTLAELVPTYMERQPTAVDIVSEQIYLRLGVADAAAVKLSREDITVLTDDLDLYLATVAEGHHPINFTYRRAESGLV